LSSFFPALSIYLELELDLIERHVNLLDVVLAELSFDDD